MGEGDQVYHLTPGKPPQIEDLVFMFDPVGAESVATLAEQKKAFEHWADSMAQET